MMARIRAILRRVNPFLGENELTYDGITVDMRKFRVIAVRRATLQIFAT